MAHRAVRVVTLLGCDAQIAGYGMCLQAKSTTGLERGACDEEFKALKRCFLQAVRQS